jgi:Tol biopolymer transport system component
MAPSWSPDGRSLAFVRAGRTICVTNSDSCLTSYVAVTVRLDGTGERVIGPVDMPLLSAGVAWQPNPS